MTTTLTLRSCALLALTTLAGYSAADDAPLFSVEKLSDSVYVLSGSGGNIGLSTGPDGTFIVDDDYAGSGAAIQATIAEISDSPVRFVVNTHWHFDHAGSNDYFNKTGSTVIAHDNARRRLQSGGFIETHQLQVDAANPEALPVLTFGESLSLHLNGEEVRVLHIESAHTDGDALVWFEDSNIMHAGDVFLVGIYPLVDYSSGGSIGGLIAAADTILSVIDDQTQVIPGHGPVGNKADVRAFREMCIKLRDRIADMKARGMSLNAVIENPPTADLDATWNSWGDRWRAISLHSIYESSP